MILVGIRLYMADAKSEAKSKEKEEGEKSDVTEYDAYFDMVQSRKKLSPSLQEKLTAAFTRIPVSSFPQVPRGKGISIHATHAFILFFNNQCYLF